MKFGKSDITIHDGKTITVEELLGEGGWYN